ncbi:MAG: dicarboxylate/amino acid:cation symporter [Verrucomicrobiota bacterium]
MHSEPAAPSRTPWYRVLYIQVLIAVAVGIAIGHFYPDQGKALEPLSKGFISLIKMMIAPIIFCTVVHGIASIGDVKKLGRVGGKTLLYFEIVSTLALVIGLIVVNTLRPGDGFNADLTTLDAKDVETVQGYAGQAKNLSTTAFLLGIIPKTFVSAFTEGNLLQVVFVALLAAFAIAGLGERGKPVLHVVDRASDLFFGIMRIVIKVAPLGALGAMAHTIGSYGIGSLQQLLKLMLGFYLTSALFVVVVLGLIARAAGFSIFRFLIYIKEELLVVLGTSSSETVLPQMIQKLRGLGCAPSTVGLVIPTGYSFNLDGTNIYMVMGAVFLAQATNTPMDLSQQIALLAVAMVTSKGASGVTGAGFITLAATLAAVPSVPVEAMALILGIDRFMSECRSLTNLVGNGVATVVISRWEGEVSAEALQANLREPIPPPPPNG